MGYAGLGFIINVLWAVLHESDALRGPSLWEPFLLCYLTDADSVLAGPLPNPTPREPVASVLLSALHLCVALGSQSRVAGFELEHVVFFWLDRFYLWLLALGLRGLLEN